MKNEALTDTPTETDERVSRLLGNLPRVAAPGDFDLRVRAGIARGVLPANGGFRLPAALAYALGLGVVLVAFGLLGVVWMYSGNVTAVPSVAGVEQADPPVTSPVIVPGNVPAAKSDQPIATAEVKRRESNVSVPLATSLPKVAVPDVRRSAPWSTDDGVGEARKVYPAGINPNLKSVPRPKDMGHGRPIPAKELLSFLGVGATYDGAGWRVDSVSSNSTAERYGVRSGDIIEAINDQAVNESTSFKDSFTGKSLRVRRDGKVQVIRLAAENK